MPPEQEVQQEQSPPSLREVIDAAAADLTDKELSTPDDASPPDDDLSSSPDQDSGVVDSDLESSQSDTDNFLDEDPDLELGPSDQEEQEQEQVDPETVDPALRGWNEEMKEFHALPKGIQDKIITRERERNADYTRKQQGMQGAVNFAEAIAPVFSDPALQQELRLTNRTPQTAIAEWASFHKELSAPQYETRVGAIQRIMAAAQIDPAHLIPNSQQQGNIPALPEEELADPAINNLHRTNQALQKQLNEITFAVKQNQIEQQTQQQLAQQAQRETAVKRAGDEIQTLMSEKGSDGKLIRPHMKKLLPVMNQLYRPGVSLNELYEEACYKDPSIRKTLIASETAKTDSVQRGKRAEVAKKANIKTVSKQATPAKEMNGNAPTIREAMNAALDDLDA